MGTKPKTFSHSELRTATGDFSQENRLGAGGFGTVYKGTLSDGRIVAAKQLSVASHHGQRQFEAEIVSISAVQHRNLVKLYGCCTEEKERILVYEYLENGSLDHALFGENALHLTWPTRYSICLGMAKGLSYLHEDSNPRIIHRDVKASNILLDADFKPKISDFGLAKLFDDNKTHISTQPAGTFGYLAPEYVMNGRLTEKADVFGFGVVALEILGGRPNKDTKLEEDKRYLLEWARNLNEAKHPLELIDPTLSKFDEGQALRMFEVALLCTNISPDRRPSMSRVVAMLSDYPEVSSVTSPPSDLNVQQSNGSTCSQTDYMLGGSVGTTTNGQETISRAVDETDGRQYDRASATTTTVDSKTFVAPPIKPTVIGGDGLQDGNEERAGLDGPGNDTHIHCLLVGLLLGLVVLFAIVYVTTHGSSG